MEKYQIIKEIYRGNSIVYEAVTKKDNKKVVLKFTEREEGENEQRILTRLNTPKPNPGVIDLIETFTDNDQTVLVFPFVEDKKRLIPGNLPLIRACMAQLLSILAFVHSKGIVHGDVKPDNVLFDGSKVILIDFSHSMFVEDIDDLEVGTGSYSAPELHLAMTDEFTVKVDVWSVAVILHEWITGKRLFHGNAAAYMDKIETFLDSVERHGVQLSNVGVDGSDICSLLSEMFQKRARMRPTAMQCLDSRWFTSGPIDDPTKFVTESDIVTHPDSNIPLECKRSSSVMEKLTLESDSECSSARASEAGSMPTTPTAPADRAREKEARKSPVS